ncbi:hypothetical protein SprV_0100044600 [Sparganum proliferum]
MQTVPHLGDDEAVVRPTIDVTVRLGHHHVLLISPPNENIVQNLPAARSGCIQVAFCSSAGVGQQEAVFSAGSQKKEAIVVAAGDSVRT